jgi:heat shock protein HslJ
MCAVLVFANGEQEGAAPPGETPSMEAAVPGETPSMEAVAPDETPPVETPGEMPPLTREWMFADILEKVWRLAAIKIGYGSIQLNRPAMETAGIDELYVLQFKEEGISGKALFNYYFAPYAKHEGKEVAFRQIVGTRMANTAVVNVGGLGEEAYYRYLQWVTRWDIVNNRLELSSGDSEIVLYYIE